MHNKDNHSFDDDDRSAPPPSIVDCSKGNTTLSISKLTDDSICSEPNVSFLHATINVWQQGSAEKRYDDDNTIISKIQNDNDPNNIISLPNRQLLSMVSTPNEIGLQIQQPDASNAETRVNRTTHHPGQQHDLPYKHQVQELLVEVPKFHCPSHHQSKQTIRTTNSDDTKGVQQLATKELYNSSPIVLSNSNNQTQPGAVRLLFRVLHRLIVVIRMTKGYKTPVKAL
jgi:hypothetical protein